MSNCKTKLVPQPAAAVRLKISVVVFCTLLFFVFVSPSLSLTFIHAVQKNLMNLKILLLLSLSGHKNNSSFHFIMTMNFIINLGKA